MANVDSLSILITASTTSAQRKVDELVESLNKLVTAINKIDMGKFEVLASATNSLSEGLKGLKGASAKSLTKVAEALNSVSAQKGAFDPIVEGEAKVAEESKAAAAGIKKVDEEVNSFDAEPLDQVAQAAANVSDNITETTSRMSGFKSLLARLRIIIPTEGLVEVNKKIDTLSAKVKELKERMEFKKKDAEYVDSEAMERDKQKIQGLINELERLKLKKQELESHGGFKLNLSGALKGLGNTVSTVTKKMGGLISNLRKTKSHTRDTAKATKNFDLSATSLAKSLTKVTRMLRLMVIRMALRSVIKEVGNGFKSLAIHSQEFDSAMSGVINSSKTLAYSFSAMVSPLLNALAPALQFIINLLTKFMNILNQIFSALTGKGTWNKAKNFTGSWADSLASANKNAKELKKTVLAFDELNQLDDNKDSGSGGGGGDIADMYETLPIADKWKDLADYIKNLAKRLFEPIKKAWEKVGDFVKDSWKYAMDEVYKLGQSVARDFWKVWEQEKTQKVFENILTAIAYIGQAVGNLAKQFRKAWDSNDNGLRILEAIRDIVLIVTNHIKSMAKATAEWAESLDFEPLLTGFRTWLESLEKPADTLMGILNDIYTKVILPLGKWAVEVGGKELFRVFTEFNEKVDWDHLRQRLQDLWEALEPFAEKVGEGLIKFIEKVSDKLADFVNSDKFDKFIDCLIKWMDGVDADEIARGLEVLVGAFVGFKLLQGIGGILTGILTFLKPFCVGGTAYGAVEGIGLVAGVINTLALAVGTLAGIKIGSEVKDFITDLGLAKAIDAGDQEEIERLQNLKDAYQGTSGAIDMVVDAYKDLAHEYNSDIAPATRTLYDEAGKAIKTIDGMGNTVIDFTGRSAQVTNALTEMQEKQKTVTFEDIRRNLTNLDGGFKDSTKNIQQSSGYIGDATKNVEKVISDFSVNSSVSIEDLSSTASSALREMSINSTESMSDFSNAVSDGSYTVEESLYDMEIAFSDTSGQMDIEMQTLVQTTDDATNSMEESFDTLKDSFSKDKWTFSGIADGLRESFENAKNSIKGVWNEIADRLNGEHQIGMSRIRINLPHFYATGGFPEDGWFRASQGEIMGRFDNGQSVVANNMQITDGIAKAVYAAIMSANGGNQSTKYINNTIQIDGRAIARAVTIGQDKMNRLYSPTGY